MNLGFCVMANIEVEARPSRLMPGAMAEIELWSVHR